MRKKTKWLGLLLAVLMVFALAACGGGENAGDDTKGNDDASNATELTFWAPFSGPDGPKMKQIVEDYNQSQDQYKVNFQIVPQTEYYKTVDLAFNGEKNAPDFLIIHGDQMTTYAKKGVIKNLDDVIGETISKDQYHENAWENVTVDGSLYGFPLDIQPLMLYWNKDLFKEAGLDPETPPTNREEFLEYAQKLTNKDKNQYGFVVPTLWPQQFIFPTLVAQNGGELMVDGKINFTSDAVVEALQFQRDLIEKYQVSPADVQQDGEVTMFLQGKNAMHLNGPWMLKQWEDSGMNFGVAPVPQFGTVKAVYANSHNFAINNNVDDSKVTGITDFLKYIADNGMTWAESGQAPASKAVYESEEFNQLYQQPKVAQQFDYVKVSPDVENWGQISNPLFEAVNVALLGQKDIKEALEEAEKKAQQILEQ